MTDTTRPPLLSGLPQIRRDLSIFTARALKGGDCLSAHSYLLKQQTAVFRSHEAPPVDSNIHVHSIKAQTAASPAACDRSPARDETGARPFKGQAQIGSNQALSGEVKQQTWMTAFSPPKDP